jgi:hypothetical protein
MRIAWLTDWHGIYVDRDAWELALNLVRDYKPTHVPVGSDDIDFYTISQFDKNPERRETLQDELDFQWKLFEELKDACDPMWRAKYRSPRQVCQHPTVIGNHNERLLKTLVKDPKFFHLRVLEYRNLMGYSKFGFSWAGKPRDFKANSEWSPIPGLTFVHGTKVSQYPGYSVKNQMASRFYDSSLVMGHVHRGAQTVVTKPDGTQLWGIEGFCLCQLNPEYVKHPPNWTQGVVFITVHGTEPEFEFIPFRRTLSRVYTYWREKEYRVPITRSTPAHV